MLHETIEAVLRMNREVAFRNDTERGETVISVTGFNKAQNIKWCHSFKLENKANEKEVAQIIHLLNERLES
jgi:hypothetical protein